MSLLEPRRGEVDLRYFALRVHSVYVRIVKGSSIFEFSRCSIKFAQGANQGGRRMSLQSSFPQRLRLINMTGTLLHQSKGVTYVRICRINFKRLAEKLACSVLIATRLLVDSPRLPPVDAIGTLLGARPEGLPGWTAPAVDLRSRSLPPSLEAGQRQIRVSIVRVDVEDLAQYRGGLPPLPRAFEVAGLPEHSPDVAPGVVVIVATATSVSSGPAATIIVVPRSFGRCFRIRTLVCLSVRPFRLWAV